MDNVIFREVETLGGIQTYAIIDRGNGEFTSMLKSTYDEQQTAQAMPLPMPETVEILPEEVQAEPVIPEA